MATATQRYIRIPRIEVYGLGDLQRLNRFILEGEVGTEFENLGTRKEFRELATQSIPLRDMRALYEIGLRSEKLGETLDLPDSALEAGKVIYALVHANPDRGNVTADAADYSAVRLPKGGLEGYRAVRWTVRPTGFEKKDGVWVVTLGEFSEPKDILVPPSGFAEMTNDGLYRPDTGTPFATTPDKGKAIASLVSRGIPQEIAEKETSFFWSAEEGAGFRAVVRWHDPVRDGPFSVDTVDEPSGGGLGSLPLRTAERSEARPRTGVTTLPDAEYKRLAADSRLLADIRQRVKQ